MIRDEDTYEYMHFFLHFRVKGKHFLSVDYLLFCLYISDACYKKHRYI